MSSPTSLEKVIRPIVEGQIKGFLKEHPSILAGVDWYKPRDDKAVTFINSLAKRIVLDLISANSAARLKAALLAGPTGMRQHSDLGIVTEAEAPNVALVSALGSLIPANERIWHCSH